MNLIVVSPFVSSWSRVPGEPREPRLLLPRRTSAVGIDTPAVFFDGADPGFPLETLVVRGRSVDGGHRDAIQPEIHGQLAAVVRLVRERVGDHDVPRILHPEPPGGFKSSSSCVTCMAIHEGMDATSVDR
jgi:hypothetical protein